MNTSPKIIRTALLSYGTSGKLFHAPFIVQHPGFALAGAWERSKQLIRQDFEDAVSYKSLEELLADPSIDLVVVNTPVATHFEYAQKALQAGKHVIVEKAFTTTVNEATQLKASADKNGLLLAVFQNRRWDSDFKTVQRIIQLGVLGKITEMEIRFDRYNPELSPKQHKEIPSPGAGVLMDLGPHLIDQALHLFGMPEAIFADLRITREHSQVQDSLEILCYYSALRVRLKASFLVREAVPAFQVYGTLGTFLKSRADIQEDALKTGKKPGMAGWGTEPDNESGLLHTMSDGRIRKEKVISEQGNYIEFYEGIYQAMVHDTPLPVTSMEGIAVMQIIEAAIQSHLEKRVIELK